MGEFVSAWTERVREHGYVAGAYGNARNITNDWLPGSIANPPDAVWLVPWVCGRTQSCDWTPTVFGVPGLDDAHWADYQRIRQYWGPHSETWDGITFEIDSDYANGPVAAESPTASCWEIVPRGRWRGEYFDNTGLSGAAAMLRDHGEADLDFDWGPESPGADCGVPADGFSVRWTRTLHLDDGRYRFNVAGDEGLRLHVDDVIEIDQWENATEAVFTATVDLSAGEHTIRLEYFEINGGANAALTWTPLSISRRSSGRRRPSH